MACFPPTDVPLEGAAVVEVIFPFIPSTTKIEGGELQEDTSALLLPVQRGDWLHILFKHPSGWWIAREYAEREDVQRAAPSAGGEDAEEAAPKHRAQKKRIGLVPSTFVQEVTRKLPQPVLCRPTVPTTLLSKKPALTQLNDLCSATSTSRTSSTVEYEARESDSGSDDCCVESIGSDFGDEKEEKATVKRARGKSGNSIATSLQDRSAPKQPSPKKSAWGDDTHEVDYEKNNAESTRSSSQSSAQPTTASGDFEEGGESEQSDLDGHFSSQMKMIDEDVLLTAWGIDPSTDAANHPRNSVSVQCVLLEHEVQLMEDAVAEARELEQQCTLEQTSADVELEKKTQVLLQKLANAKRRTADLYVDIEDAKSRLAVLSSLQRRLGLKGRSDAGTADDSLTELEMATFESPLALSYGRWWRDENERSRRICLSLADTCDKETCRTHWRDVAARLTELALEGNSSQGNATNCKSRDVQSHHSQQGDHLMLRLLALGDSAEEKDSVHSIIETDEDACSDAMDSDPNRSCKRETDHTADVKNATVAPVGILSFTELANSECSSRVAQPRLNSTVAREADGAYHALKIRLEKCDVRKRELQQAQLQKEGELTDLKDKLNRVRQAEAASTVQESALQKAIEAHTARGSSATWYAWPETLPVRRVEDEKVLGETVASVKALEHSAAAMDSQVKAQVRECLALFKVPDSSGAAAFKDRTNSQAAAKSMHRHENSEESSAAEVLRRLEEQQSLLAAETARLKKRLKKGDTATKQLQTNVDEMRTYVSKHSDAADEIYRHVNEIQRKIDKLTNRKD